jgi:CRISPR-associated endonuclease Csy4
MVHYLDIHLRPDPEFSAAHLLAALYAKLHRALVRLEAGNIGVSFPGHDESAHRLGHCLRLIGPVDDLARLMALDWLSGMRDHVNVGGTAPVPANAQHRTLRRVQAKSNPERLRRRQMKRHGLTEAQAQQQVPDSVGERLALPFVQMTSASTGETFRLFLRLGPPQPTLVAGSFNSYGLSTLVTIPWF